jgi:hypothetical protein
MAIGDQGKDSVDRVIVLDPVHIEHMFASGADGARAETPALAARIRGPQGH